jgi:hypothetical protein
MWVAQRGRKSLLWLLVSMMTLMFGGAFAVPAQAASSSHAAPGTGTIEICKSSRYGMTGQSFNFSLNGGAAITVDGGTCSGPIVTHSGQNTVVEAPTAGYKVQAIQANHTVSKNLNTGTIVVRVKPGSTPADETLVTYVNRHLPALGLKVCKVAGDAALQGNLYSFTENGGPAYSVAAGTPAAPICGPVHSYKLGTNVNVAELATPGTYVSAITVSDNRGSNVDLTAGTVTATVGSGVTVVTYTNNVTPTPQLGYIEVCKAAGDQYVSGNFDFTITGSGGYTSSRTVAVGQCTEPIQVPAGNVNVAEAARFPYYTTAIGVAPAGRLVHSNLANQTATVSVPKGDSSTETVVTFTNSTHTAQVKVCKALTANSGALAGTKFWFTVTDVNGQHSVSVVAGAAGSTTCVIDSSQLPLGSAVSISEQGVPNVQVVSVGVSPASQDTGSYPPTANLTVGSGITTATFTNEAFGTIEVCKAAADASTATQTFHFSVNSGPQISVHAGQCSTPIAVPAGTATVYEASSANFHLVGVAANNGRLISGTTDNPATVSVPFGGVSNETVVTFTNAVNTGEFKICKVSPEPTLQGVSFSFGYSYTIGAVTTTGTASLQPGQCSALSGDIPVVDASGNPIAVHVSEAPTPTVQVSNISVDNGTLAASDLGAGTATVYVNQGFTTVTYTNVRTPIGNGGSFH